MNPQLKRLVGIQSVPHARTTLRKAIPRKAHKAKKLYTTSKGATRKLNRRQWRGRVSYGPLAMRRRKSPGRRIKLRFG